MAQKITSTTISIGVSFEREKTTWKYGKMRYLGTSKDLRNPSAPIMFHGTNVPIPSIGSPIALGDPTPIFDVRCLGSKKQALYETPKGHIGMKDGIPASDLDLSGEEMEILVSTQPTGKTFITGDPWCLREEFLGLSRSVDKLLAFLTAWGSPFGFGQLLFPFNRHGNLLPLEETARPPLIVYPADIWKLQDQYNAALLCSPEEWLRERAPIGLITHQTEFPYLVAKANDIKTAIEMTITIDKLNKVPFQKCEREDCNISFPVRLSKRYCSQECGHLVSVRRNRAEARKIKLIATHKKSKTGQRL
jgi:hypothetical protein